MDNALAMDQMEVAYATLLNRPVISRDDQAVSFTRHLAIDELEHPRIVRCAQSNVPVRSVLLNSILPQPGRRPHDCPPHFKSPEQGLRPSVGDPL